VLCGIISIMVSGLAFLEPMLTLVPEINLLIRFNYVFLVAIRYIRRKYGTSNSESEANMESMAFGNGITAENQALLHLPTIYI
jgi:hypothetical protein